MMEKTWENPKTKIFDAESSGDNSQGPSGGGPISWNHVNNKDFDSESEEENIRPVNVDNSVSLDRNTSLLLNDDGVVLREKLALLFSDTLDGLEVTIWDSFKGPGESLGGV